MKGGEEYFVEPTIMTFSNHGCNGTFNIIEWSSEKEPDALTEQTATPSDYEEHAPFQREFYDIFYDRHIAHNALTSEVAKRDIKAGEEILSDYLFLISSESEWNDYAKVLKRICNGEEVGDIAQAEEEAKKSSL